MNGRWQNVDELAVLLALAGKSASDAWDEACWGFDLACMVMSRPISFDLARETIKKDVPDWPADIFDRLVDLSASYAEHVEPEPEPVNIWSLDPRAD